MLALRRADRPDHRQRRRSRRCCPVVVVMAVRLGAPAVAAPDAARVRARMPARCSSSPASPVNVIVSEAADDAGVGRFGFFEFALVGVPLARRHDRDRRAPRRAAAPDTGPAVDPARLQRPRANARRAVRRSTTSRTPADARRGRRRGRHPATLRPRRRDGVPGDGHRERRPRRARRPAQGRGRSRRDHARGRRHAPPPGDLGRARRAPRRPRRARGRRARRRSVARPCRSGRARSATLVVLAGDGRAARDGAVPAGRRRAACRGRDRPLAACSRSSRPTAASSGRR